MAASPPASSNVDTTLIESISESDKKLLISDAYEEDFQIKPVLAYTNKMLYQGDRCIMGLSLENQSYMVVVVSGHDDRQGL